MEPVVNVQADPRGGYTVCVRWSRTDDHEKTVFEQASTHATLEELAVVVATACKAKGYLNPFSGLPVRGA